MKRANDLRPRYLPARLALLALTVIAMPVPAHEPAETIPYPGYRPASEYAADFLDSVGTAEIAVLPTIVRRIERSAHSFESQDEIVVFLNEAGVGTAVSKPLRIDLGPLRRPTQWEVYQYGVASIGTKLEGYGTGADYVIVMELLVPGNQSVGGIEVYVMDQSGRNAFSFLLNSHHKMFVDAELYARNASEKARAEMIRNATRVGLTALMSQIEQTRSYSPPFLEARIDEHSSRITFETSHGNGLVVEKVMSLACGCAQLAIDRGFHYFVIDEQEQLSDNKGSSRITFYSVLPEGVPLATELLQGDQDKAANFVGAAIDAFEMRDSCSLLKTYQ